MRVKIKSVPGQWEVVPEDRALLRERLQREPGGFTFFSAQKVWRGTLNESIRSFDAREIERVTRV